MSLANTLSILALTAPLLIASCGHRGRSKTEPPAETLPAHPTITVLLAAKTGNLAQLQANLYWGCDVNMIDDRGDTPLHWAAYMSTQAPPVGPNSVEAVKLLLDKGAIVDSRDKNGETPLYMGHGKETTDLLIAKGANIEATANNGTPPIYEAAMSCDIDKIASLMAHGASTKIRTAGGGNLLTAACNPTVRSWLVEHGVKD